MDLEPLIVAAVRAGKDYHIASGNYQPFYLRGAVAPVPVKITADPGVVLSDIVAQRPVNLTFSDLKLAWGGTQTAVLNIQGGSGIHVDGCEFTGKGHENGGTGISLADCPGSSVTGSSFHDLQGGISAKLADGLTINANDFHDLRVDCIQVMQSSHVAVINNTATDIYPQAGDHPDFIQFVGVSGYVADDITVKGNVWTRGKGLPIQGVFIGNEGGQTYTNITVAKNAIVGGDYNGMGLGGCVGLTLTDNLVQSYSDHGSSVIVYAGTSFGTTSGNIVSAVANNAGASIPTGGFLPGKPVATMGDLTALAAWKTALTAPVKPPMRVITLTPGETIQIVGS